MRDEGPDDADADLMEEANVGTRCPNCREVIWDEAEQCPSCRHWITPADRHRDDAGLTGGWWRLVLIVIVILLVLALAMM